MGRVKTRRWSGLPTALYGASDGATVPVPVKLNLTAVQAAGCGIPTGCTAVQVCSLFLKTGDSSATAHLSTGTAVHVVGHVFVLNGSSFDCIQLYLQL